jgi:hypothetical protein
VSIEKVVPLIKTLKTIFYFNFFKFGKIGFGLNQVQKGFFSKLFKFGPGPPVRLPLSETRPGPAAAEPPPPFSYRALL